MRDPALQKLTDWLRERHADITALERKAKAALYGDKDETAYRDLMHRRAEAIAALDAGAGSLLAALQDNKVRTDVEHDLGRFAAGANNAMRIGSIFYMSALLYPDEHKDGEPDNLERLIIGLERP